MGGWVGGGGEKLHLAWQALKLHRWGDAGPDPHWSFCMNRVSGMRFLKTRSPEVALFW